LTDTVPALDVCYLRRAGFLVPSPKRRRLFWLVWSRGNQPIAVGVVAVLGARNQPPHTVVAFVQPGARNDEPDIVMVERITLAYTPCHFGGCRPWFLCPRCGRRKAVLRVVDNGIGCTRCTDVAYSSTREGFADRVYRRAHRAREALGAGHGSPLDYPPRPQGMHATTYARHCAAITAAGVVMSAEIDLIERDCERLAQRT